MTRHTIPLTQLIQDELSAYPQDALAIPAAIESAQEVFSNVVLRQHAAISASGQPLVEPTEAYAELGDERFAALMKFVNRNTDPKLSSLMAALVLDLIEGTERRFFDTHEIPTLIAAVTSAAIVARDFFPELCRHWIEGGEPPSVGDRAAALVYKRLMIDEEWTTRFDNGFSWLGHRLEQRVEWTPHFWDHATWGTLLCSSTTVLRNIRASTEAVWECLSGLSVFASGSTWQFDVEHRVLRHVCRYFFHEQSLGFRSDQHADFTILQLYEAEAIADRIAEALQGDVALAEHPVNGLRTKHDDMLNIVRDLVVPRGAGASLFANTAEIDLALDELDGRFPVQESPSRELLIVRIPLVADVDAVVRLSTSQRHPRYGSGVSVATSIELPLSREALVRTWSHFVDASLLASEGRGYGSWALPDFGEGDRLTFCRFVPNLSFGAGILRDVLMGEVGRAQWVGEQLSHAWSSETQ
jgi:hypothetical protein